MLRNVANVAKPISKAPPPHLDKGSTAPVKKKGVPIIYSMRFCPFAQRVLMIAEIYGAKYELINVNVSDKPDWFVKEKNPAGSVPVLETDEGILTESLIISEYMLAHGQSQKSLDPSKKAKDSILIQRFDQKVGSILPKILFKTQVPTETVQEDLKKLTEFLLYFDKELTVRGTPFFGGTTPGFADFMIWPFVQRLPIIRIIYPDIYNYEEAKTRLKRWEEWRGAMKLTDKTALYNKAKQIGYIKARRANSEIIYDFN